MPITVTWPQIALRLGLALVASFIIGFDRDEHGKAAGIRTTMLVCLAAALAMLEANLLLSTSGKSSGSFSEMDVMRLPLGILSGIGFIGAGTILHREGAAHGLTTAATLWTVTVLGLLFGGGQIFVGGIGTLTVALILWGLKRLEPFLPSQRYATLVLELTAAAPGEQELRQQLLRSFRIISWQSLYDGETLQSIHCDLRWSCARATQPSTPDAVRDLAALAGVARLDWKT